MKKMVGKQSYTVLTVISCFIVILFAGSAIADVRLTGSGATFPFPIYSTWFKQYNQALSLIHI